MDARTYLDTYKAEGVRRLVAAVNEALPEERRTTEGYFRQIAYGHRRPSFELADALVRHDPVRELDLTSLMRAKERREPPADATH